MYSLFEDVALDARQAALPGFHVALHVLKAALHKALLTDSALEPRHILERRSALESRVLQILGFALISALESRVLQILGFALISALQVRALVKRVALEVHAPVHRAV